MHVFLFCTDGLCGMPQAIEAVYPKSRLQRCIVHQIRSSTRYVNYKDMKQVVADLKKIHTAVTEKAAMQQLKNFAEKWRSQYPFCAKNWEENWDVLSTFFKYPMEIWKSTCAENSTILDICRMLLTQNFRECLPHFRKENGVSCRSPWRFFAIWRHPRASSEITI